MTDEHLPLGPADNNNDRLPAHQDPDTRRALMRSEGRGALGLGLVDDRDEDDSDEIDLRKYWLVLLKHRWLVLSILAAVTALALLSTLMTTPIYRASTLVQVDKGTTGVVQIEGMQPAGMGWDDEYLLTQLELLKSRSLAERVAASLNLDKSALARLETPGWLALMKGLFGSPPKPSLQKTPGTATPAEAAELSKQLAAAISGGLGVSRVPDTSLVWINYDSPSPDFSVRAANAIADGFVESNLDRRSGANSYARTFLEEQLKQTKGKLEESERKLINYARSQGLVITDDKGRTLAAQNLAQLSAALATAQQERIRAESRWRQSATSTEMLTASAVGPLQQQRAALMGEYQQKLAVFKPDYPEMQQLQRQIDEVEKQIAQEMGRLRSSVKAEYAAAQAEENALSREVAQLRGQAFDAEGSNIEYSILKRDVDTNRELYDGLLQRYKEVGAANDTRANNISIVDRAQSANRTQPNLRSNLIRGLLFGALLGVLAAFLLEFLDDRLKSPQDVEQKLRLPVLGVIPKLGAKERIADASEDSRSGFSEAYRSVRATLQFSTDHGVPKTLLITSAGPGEGKSTAALTLARNFAQLGKSVLLIEADLRNPSLHRTLGLEGRNIGLSNLLSGACTLSETLQPTNHERLSVILAGPLPPNPAELLSGSKLVSLLTVAVERFDQVIIDGPPVLGLADAPILSNITDGTLLMVDAGKTRIRPAQAALKRLMAARARVVGALLSKYDAHTAGYGYGYGYGYQYGTYKPDEDKPRLSRG
jgi:capsular exopolysaccharide synthesis family protein